MPWGDVGAGVPTSGASPLGGRYELLRLLGTGGSGAVFLAHDLVLHREVAVKLLRPGQDEVAYQRLNQEARLAASLAHPGVARLLDVGEDETTLGGAPYLVMEYVDGRTLGDLLRSGERLGIEQVMSLLAQVAEAVAAVHAAGIVHRDLKPGNIMLAASGRAVLLDFGIARHHSGEPLTLTGTIVGTVDYISPEQASGASATTASDLYALGTVAYECLTGLRPLHRDTQVSTLMAHATTPLPPMPATIPVGIRELVEAMVALDPAQRPPSAAAVAARARALLRELEELEELGETPGVVPPSGADPLTAAISRGPAGDTVAPRATIGLAARRRRYALVGACAVLLAAAGMVVMGSRDGDPAAPVAAGAADAAIATSATPSPTASAPVVLAAVAGASRQASGSSASTSSAHRHPAAPRARGHRSAQPVGAAGGARPKGHGKPKKAAKPKKPKKPKAKKQSHGPRRKG